MKTSSKMRIIGIVVFVIFLIVGCIVADGNYYLLECSSIAGGQEKADRINAAALFVTGSDIGADEWVEWGDQAVLGIAIMIIGIITLLMMKHSKISCHSYAVVTPLATL